MQKPVVIFGAKGLGRSVLNIFLSNDVVVYGFLDEDEALWNTPIQDVPVLGHPDDEAFLKLLGDSCNAFIATEETAYKKSMVELLKKRKVVPVNAIHRHTAVPESTQMGHGNMFDAGVCIGGGVVLGSHCTLHAGAIMDYEARIGDYVHIGPGATIGANALLEDHVYIGASATIVPGIKIARGASIGAGSVVISHVKEDERMFGNPAQPYTA